ncbi:Olfactory receptor 2G2 [Sciurus carolinensis]|uniref:Olfactory receptor 2G2 n=1 Tax=Sciurus carolinensis TaxID=30640 RepID=A0AA41N2F5_SCICA|nr:Olfactory receptor 2G2 [Sciurus carolinensis]
MSFDHSVTIGRPLHYTLIMNQHVCILLVTIMWLSGISYTIVEDTLMSQLPLCGINEQDQFFCEIPVLFSYFYGPGIAMYLHPSSISWDKSKFMTLFYGVVTPTLNPFIYALRNKDVKEVLGNW